MNAIMKLMLVAGAAVLSGHALASTQVYTATIDRAGNLVHQDASWIKDVTLKNQRNYFATYEVTFNNEQFKKAPVFCSASAIDSSNEDRLYYGHVKLGGAATAEKVNVLALFPGKSGPSGDSSMSFQLMCVR